MFVKSKNKQPRTRRQKIVHYFLLGLAGFFALLLIVIADAVVRLMFINGGPIPKTEARFIVANPVNLSQIGGISKFRSCQGHTFAGKGEDGVIESKRSMKHYLAPLKEITNELGTIEIFAPFDGKIEFVLPEGKGDQIIISPKEMGNWGLVIFHVDRLEGIGRGSKVSAGQKLGHANVKDRHDFDIALTYTSGSLLAERISSLVVGSKFIPLPKSSYLASAFDYMTDDVLKQFDDAGFDTKNLKYSREYRDQNPCDFSKSGTYEDDWQYLPGQNLKELSQPAPGVPSGPNQPQNTPTQLYPPNQN